MHSVRTESEDSVLPSCHKVSLLKISLGSHPVRCHSICNDADNGAARGHYRFQGLRKERTELTLPALTFGRRQWHPTPALLPGKSHGRGSLGGRSPWWSLRVRHNWATSLSLFTFMHWRKKWKTHSRVLAWRIPGMGEPSGLPSMGSHRVGHDWSDLAVAPAAFCLGQLFFNYWASWKGQTPK